jgi:general secretion pathway protein G
MGRTGKTFTLIELLVVIAIIGLLVGILLPALFSSKERALYAKARANIKKLETALQSYESDWSIYPPDTGGAFTSSNLVIYLDGDTSNGGPKTVYFEFKAEDLQGGNFVDPWDRSYHYRLPGVNNTRSYDLWCEGTIPATYDSTGTDDIINW